MTVGKRTLSLLCIACITLFGSNGAIARATVTEAMVAEVNRLHDDGLFAQALSRAEALLGDNAADPANELQLELLNLKAMALSELGRHEEALHQKAHLVALRIIQDGPHHSNTLMAKQNLAVSYLYLQRYDEALVELKQLRDLIFRNHQSLEPELSVLVATNLALGLGLAGNLGDSVVLAQLAADISKARLAENHLQRLTAERNLAQVLIRSGKTTEGLTLAREVVNRHEMALSAEHPDTGMAWNVLGQALFQDDQFTLAESAFRRAGNILEARHGSLFELTLSARLNQEFSRWNGSLELNSIANVKRLQWTIESKFGPSSHYSLKAKSFLATIHLHHGQADEALHLFEQLTREWMRLGGKSAMDTMWAQLGFARALAARGSRIDALVALGDLIPQLEVQRFVMGAAAGPASQVKFSELVSDAYGLRSFLQRELGQFEDSLDTLEQGRAHGLLDWLALREGLTARAMPKEMLESWNQTLERVAILDSRIAKQANSPQSEGWRGERRKLESALADLGRTLRQAEGLVDEAGKWKQLVGSTSLIYAQQPDGRYQAYLRTPDGQISSKGLSSAPHLSWTIEAFRAWTASGPESSQWVDEHGQPRKVYSAKINGESLWLLSGASERCSTAEWAQHLQYLQRQATRNWISHPRAANQSSLSCLPPGSKEVQGQAAYQELARQLGHYLLSPLHGQRLKAGQSLAIIPDGQLWTIPWDALLWRGRHLVQQADVQLIPSLGVATRLQERRQKDYLANRNSRLLALGDVHYGHRTEPSGTDATRERRYLVKSVRDRGDQGVDISPSQLQRLPYSRIEVERASQVFGSSQSEIWLGSMASERRLREWSRQGKLKDFDVVLMATHGWFDIRWPELSAIVLGRDGPDHTEDGVLYAPDLLGLHLNARVLILSSCHSGRGAISRSEGLVGLPYAAMVAGASSTVQTLWQIQDASTAQFVTRFLTHLRQGRPPVSALATTKREFQRSPNPRLANPRVWAAFGLNGV
ncbi:CHAT domain-containing tetratricopeptide repeat protein [Ideonella paludis]|uniref:CHAT domain-containing protein n=1 Tax=Ideonella paludis TaxID=1233411 RepID=A0ABS5DYT3_9BURK|nr:CHAT domain-containing tetratricopeptide repeat protein [Ideonella paludis]MBQ0936307.1 CHAT domain-containing protein [Ideonella paludis]